MQDDGPAIDTVVVCERVGGLGGILLFAFDAFNELQPPINVAWPFGIC